MLGYPVRRSSGTHRAFFGRPSAGAVQPQRGSWGGAQSGEGKFRRCGAPARKTCRVAGKGRCCASGAQSGASRDGRGGLIYRGVAGRAVRWVRFAQIEWRRGATEWDARGESELWRDILSRGGFVLVRFPETAATFSVGVGSGFSFRDAVARWWVRSDLGSQFSIVHCQLWDKRLRRFGLGFPWVRIAQIDLRGIGAVQVS